ncbi:LAFE_0A07778g1_1 [Lachancea fermentati]|uniref:LAFE_0A07778g1_1 n=1 Tax=Lachancea fermentati TaxID=4955 RepID=A0A1G4M728_LACFM|nr:LAFE_0A07778g1_1 [Lachancea fermentati]
MAEQDDSDFTALPLGERAVHKLWKARMHAYQELNSLFQKSSTMSVSPDVSKYWINPDLFATYITDSNVVAQEQAILALNALLEYVTELPAIPKSENLRLTWIPLLAEKGLGSSRPNTKNKTIECILLLVSLDSSVQQTIELIEPFFSNKLPRLVASCVGCINTMIESFGLININNMQSFLLQLLEPIPKLSSHADRNVRSNTMNLILEIYKWIGRDLLQDLLLENLKPIQQRDLDKMFQKYEGTIPPQSQPKLFQWQKDLEKEAQESGPDKDGDTLMGDQLSTIPSKADADALGSQIDPFDILPSTSILDKFPEDFQTRISSSKWKDRVEVLEEILNNLLIPAKKLQSKNQDYSEFLRSLSHVIQKDANVQAVTIAAILIQQLCLKLKSNFTKSYGTIVLDPLLERTKEKKPSVSEAICAALDYIAEVCGIDECLEETLNHMKHKIPQIRMECTKFLTRMLKTWKPQSRNLQDEFVIKMIPDMSIVILKIVNDTQPTIRETGFECLATLMKLVGEREVSETLEKLDNLKRKKVYEYYEKVEVLGSLQERPPTRSATMEMVPSIKSSISTKSSPIANRPANLNRGNLPSLRKPSSTLPSKRGPTSPLRTEKTFESPQSAYSRSKSRLTTRSLTTESASTLNHRAVNLDIELDDLRKQKQKWLKERQEILAKFDNFQTRTSQLSEENTMLQQQVSNLQSSLHEKTLELRSKDLQVARLQDRVSALETELEASSRLPSSNYGVRSVSSERPSSGGLSHPIPGTPPPRFTNFSADRPSSSLSIQNRPSSSGAPASDVNEKFSPVTSRRFRSPSESSDDLPHRVNSLQLNSADKSQGLSSTFVNDESWRRAAEVTSQLKARIERMRAKTRGMSSEMR